MINPFAQNIAAFTINFTSSTATSLRTRKNSTFDTCIDYSFSQEADETGHKGILGCTYLT
jgi:hypothetical protein